MKYKLLIMFLICCDGFAQFKFKDKVLAVNCDKKFYEVILFYKLEKVEGNIERLTQTVNFDNLYDVTFITNDNVFNFKTVPENCLKLAK